MLTASNSTKLLLTTWVTSRYRKIFTGGAQLLCCHRRRHQDGWLQLKGRPCRNMKAWYAPQPMTANLYTPEDDIRWHTCTRLRAWTHVFQPVQWWKPRICFVIKLDEYQGGWIPLMSSLEGYFLILHFWSMDTRWNIPWKASRKWKSSSTHRFQTLEIMVSTPRFGWRPLQTKTMSANWVNQCFRIQA